MTSFDFQQFLHFGPNSPTPNGYSSIVPRTSSVVEEDLKGEGEEFNLFYVQAG